MKNSPIILAVVLFFYSITSSYGQETRFFVPSEIKKAYEKGTRSYDGKPSSAYWQNTADYKIKVRVIPSENLIEGYEEVVYHNNGTGEINTLVIRLYHDAYKIGNPRAYAISDKDVDDGVKLSDVVINGKVYDPENGDLTQFDGTNVHFILNKPLKPDSDLKFKASWKQKIPEYSQIRTGAYDSTTFFIGYWYPQIAVYDDVFGWDNLNYTFTTEFYNNLADFDVEITTPDNFIIWATGTLKNSKEILPKNMYDKYVKARYSEKVIHIVTKNDLKKGIRLKSNKWHYIATEVTDFAFGLSNHYLWDAAGPEIKNRNVFISAAYPVDTTRDLTKLVQIQQNAIKYFSEKIPGIPYPYEAFTTFIDYGGYAMEFPMITNSGQPDIPLVTHEIFHTYFPMYVRTNERRWAWMDEGWAVFNTLLFTNRNIKNKYDTRNEFFYEYGFTNMGTVVDLPLITSSQFLTGVNYDFNSYQKPAMVYATLHHHLGEELFLKCYREYIKRWAKKSPTPYDFFYTFEDVSDQDLSWLWKPWFFEFGTADIALDTLEQDKLNIINKGSRPVPVFVEINYKNGDKKHISKSAKVWANGVNRIEIPIPNSKNIETILVNTSIVDINYLDNVLPSIKSIYKDIEIPSEIYGNYLAELYYFDISIDKKDELIYIDIPGLGISRIIYPKDKNHYISLDGSISLRFNEDESKNVKGFVLDLVGWIFICNKQI